MNNQKAHISLLTQMTLKIIEIAPRDNLKSLHFSRKEILKARAVGQRKIDQQQPLRKKGSAHQRKPKYG